MGLEEQLSGPSNRLHDFVGRDATVVNRTVTGHDEYGDPLEETTEIETTAELSTVGSGSWERRFSGIDVDASASIWLPAGVDVYDGTEADDHLASRIHIGADHYEVVDVTIEDTGRRRCLCDQQ